jgi:hypothetical protein
LSGHDAYEDEMGRFFRMRDRDLDRLLAGKAPQDDPELEELAAFLREVKAAHQKLPPESKQARQLAMILEAAQLEIPEPQVSRLPNWRKPMPAGLFSTMWTKAAVGAVAALLVCCGLAAAGALPDPLQTAAANAAGEVGVSLDNPGDTDEAGDVDAADDNEAADDQDDAAAKDDDKSKTAHSDKSSNSDSQPVSASDGTSAPAPAVTAPAPADEDNDAEDKDDDNSAPAAKDDDDNEADDENQSEDDENQSEDDHNQADDEGSGDEGHEGGSGEGESDD